MHFPGILTFVKKLKVGFFHNRMHIVGSHITKRQQWNTSLQRSRLMKASIITSAIITRNTF